jgi:hypothetical protein
MNKLRGIAWLFIMTTVVCFCTFPVLALAAGNGVAGDEIVDMLTKLLKDNTVAVAIYTSIAGLIGIGLRILLKKIPTAMQGIVGIVFWKIAAALFGDGVVLEKNTNPEYVKQQLMKKFPLLRIDVKSLGK